MSTLEQRMKMAGAILEFEARRDSKGRLKVYDLDPLDGGGAYEVAGINERYHPVEAEELADLIQKGQYEQAEIRAREIILGYTDFAASWTNVAAIESYLRDTAFNRGPRGAARILQRALGVKEDGIVGEMTLAAVATAEANPLEFLADLRQAREAYERKPVNRNEANKFWKGLVNRWNKALAFAKTLLPAGAAGAAAADMAAAGTSAAFDASVAAVANQFALADAPKAAIAMPLGAAALAFAAPVAAAADATVDTAPVAMPAMRLGSAGRMVRAWQSFLAGQGFDPGGLDGEFGDKTVAATKAFQEKYGLTADGVAGRQTIIQAMKLEFEFIDEPSPDITGSNFPPRPNFAPLTGLAARQAVFGHFDYVAAPEAGNRENIRILGDWEEKNIMRVPIPQIKKALGDGAPSGMRFHRLAAAQLQGLWKDWEDAGLLDRIQSYDGAYVPRFIRRSNVVLSNHAFGSAFDINASTNGLGIRPKLVGHQGSVRELVPIANKWGFYWGGHFGSRPDGMHFQIAFLKS